MAITLQAGDRAPEFSGKDQDGRLVSRQDYLGRKLVLYFYSEAGSPTCTIESCNLRDHYKALQSAGLDVLGISPDSMERQKKFEQKFQLPFRLIADTDLQIVQAYGVWDQKKLFGRVYMGVLRTTFLLDEKGIIRHIFSKPVNKAHAAEILEWLRG